MSQNEEGKKSLAQRFFNYINPDSYNIEERAEEYEKIKDLKDKTEMAESPRPFIQIYDTPDELIDIRNVESEVIVTRIKKEHRTDFKFYSATNISYKQYQIIEEDEEIIGTFEYDEVVEKLFDKSVEDLKGFK